MQTNQTTRDPFSFLGQAFGYAGSYLTRFFFRTRQVIDETIFNQPTDAELLRQYQERFAEIDSAIQIRVTPRLDAQNFHAEVLNPYPVETLNNFTFQNALDEKGIKQSIYLVVDVSDMPVNDAYPLVEKIKKEIPELPIMHFSWSTPILYHSLPIYRGEFTKWADQILAKSEALRAIIQETRAIQPAENTVLENFPGTLWQVRAERRGAGKVRDG